MADGKNDFGKWVRYDPPNPAPYDSEDFHEIDDVSHLEEDQPEGADPSDEEEGYNQEFIMDEALVVSADETEVGSVWKTTKSHIFVKPTRNEEKFLYRFPYKVIEQVDDLFDTQRIYLGLLNEELETFRHVAK